MTEIQSQRETWQNDALDILSSRPVCGYRADSSPQVEPTSLAMMSLQTHQRIDAVYLAGDWLAKHQRDDGRVAAEDSVEAPGWGTGLAILAWCANADGRWDSHIKRGVDYLLNTQGTVFENKDRLVEHDTTIPGWSWIQGTHSWLEPTAMSVAALQAAGFGSHQRAIDGRRLLVDRILPSGGCNYGNTIVLKQFMRPQAQPTGIALLALAGSQHADREKISKTLDYLETYLTGPTTTISASYALMALAAHGRVGRVERIHGAVQETLARHVAPGHLALALMAVEGRESSLVKVCLGVHT